MRKTLLIIATSLPTLGVGLAQAADLPRYTPPPAAVYSHSPAYDWSGFYVGVQGGYDWNHATTPPAFAADENGGILGVYAGYNWMFASNWLLGVDASINYSWATGSDPTIANDSAGPNWKGFVRGRLGYAWDKFLVYGTAGAAGMGYTANVTGLTSGTASPWGWTVGLGAEMALTQNVTARLDYAYSDFGTFTLGGPGPIGGTTVAVKSHTLMLGAAMKF